LGKPAYYVGFFYYLCNFYDDVVWPQLTGAM
jgi:hypothetical protein